MNERNLRLENSEKFFLTLYNSFEDTEISKNN